MVYLLNAKKIGKWKGPIEMKNELTQTIWRSFLHEFIIKAWWQNGCSYKNYLIRAVKQKEPKKRGQAQITTCKFLWDLWSFHNNNVQFWASNLWQAQWCMCFFVSARERKGTQISHNNKSKVWRKSMREHHHHHTSFWIWVFLFCFLSLFLQGPRISDRLVEYHLVSHPLIPKEAWLVDDWGPTHPRVRMMSGLDPPGTKSAKKKPLKMGKVR